MFSSAEIIRQSVCEVTSDKIYDEFTHLPNFNAINDPRMGTVSRDQICLTCRAEIQDCSGHFGHISLALPVFHPGMLDHIKKILYCVCFNCSKILVRKDEEIENLKKIKNK